MVLFMVVATRSKIELHSNREFGLELEYKQRLGISIAGVEITLEFLDFNQLINVIIVHKIDFTNINLN